MVSADVSAVSFSVNYYIRKRIELTLKPTHKVDTEDSFAFSFSVCVFLGSTVRKHRSFYYIELFINTRA